MAAADFIAELQALGYSIEELAPDRIVFPFEIPVGSRTGNLVRLGFIVPGDYRATPPSGPHVSPRLFPNRSGGDHPTGGIHDSDFGPDFHYWSRPFNEWAKTTRNASAYMRFIRRLFDTL